MSFPLDEPVPANPAATPSDPALDPVRAAVAQLDAISDQPLEHHPDAYQQVHQTLQQALSDIPT
jgi:hypothetical protein